MKVLNKPQHQTVLWCGGKLPCQNFWCGGKQFYNNNIINNQRI